MCETLFIVAGTMSPRNHKWAMICLEQCEGEGNFTLDFKAPRVHVHDGERRELGPVITAHYGKGNYRPHNPSHFLADMHADDNAHATYRKVNNPWLPMDHMDVD